MSDTITTAPLTWCPVSVLDHPWFLIGKDSEVDLHPAKYISTKIKKELRHFLLIGLQTLYDITLCRFTLQPDQIVSHIGRQEKATWESTMAGYESTKN